MRNILAVLVTLAVFTGTIVVVNGQLVGQIAAEGGGLNFDIYQAAEGLGALFAGLIGEAVGPGFAIPWFASLALGAFGLSLPALFAYTLLASSGG